ncbi:hypothetical protein HU200_056011 [Digitaria exilis]|uniref:Uncharacterized protein n=1 Tax=Digitaria exilis TaxID=1010633 RepID=A0A835E112_9POAL|nr:hypothetical protein HU200_056011 [Digitaria exilis]
MAYEAAAAVATRDQQQSQVRSGEDNGGARGRRQLPVEEEKAVVMRCGVLKVLRRVLPLSKKK